MSHHDTGYIELWKKANVDITSSIQLATSRSHHKELVVCTGSEWYYFPSHFFLSSSARLEFISDDFHGQLPHHFQHLPNNQFWLGTSMNPLIPFNDDNKGDDRVFVPIDRCDYFVHLHRDSSPANTILNSGHFDLVLSTEVLDAANSPSSIARAFYIPFYSQRLNKMKKYSLYKRLREAN